MLPRRRKLVYSNHALEEMGLRGISKEDVRVALENHDTSYPGMGRKRTIHKIGTAPSGRRLNVILAEKPSNLVVTAYWWEGTT